MSHTANSITVWTPKLRIHETHWQTHVPALGPLLQLGALGKGVLKQTAIWLDQWPLFASTAEKARRSGPQETNCRQQNL